MGRPMLSPAPGKAMVFSVVHFSTVRWRGVECTIKSSQQAWHEIRRSTFFFCYLIFGVYFFIFAATIVFLRLIPIENGKVM